MWEKSFLLFRTVTMKRERGGGDEHVEGGGDQGSKGKNYSLKKNND